MWKITSFLNSAAINMSLDPVYYIALFLLKFHEKTGYTYFYTVFDIKKLYIILVWINLLSYANNPNLYSIFNL